MKQTDHICPQCQAHLFEDGTCPFATDHVATKAALPREETLRSSDWVAELEAALTHLMNAQNALAKTASPVWLQSIPIGTWLRDTIAAERGRSATAKVQVRRELASDEGSAS